MSTKVRVRNTTTRKLPVPQGYRLSPPEGGWGWVVLAGILLVTTMMSIPGSTFGILMQDIQVAMDTSTAAVASAPSVSMSSSNFVSPLVTMAIHMFSCRKTAIFGGIMITAGMFLSYFARNIQTLVFAFGLFTGIGYGFCRISCLVLASYYFHRRYNIAASCIYTGFSLGRLLFSPLVQIFNQTFGFRGTFVLMGGIALNICVGASLFQPVKWHYVLTPIEGKDDDTKNTNGTSPSNKRNQSDHKNVQFNGKNGTVEHLDVELTDYKELDNVDGCLNRPGTGGTAAQIEVAASEFPVKVAHSADKDVGKTTNNNNDNGKAKNSGGGGWRLRDALDFTLLKESVFYVILASHVLTYLSLMYGILFLVPLGRDKGLTSMEAAMLPTIRAFAEIVGRILFPVIVQTMSDLDPVLLYILTCILTGIGFMALVTGLMTGGSVVQNTTIILYSVGSKKLPSTLGLCAFFQGFFTLIGGPLIGWVRDSTGSLVMGYLLIAAFQGACALVWIYRYITLWRHRKTAAAAAVTTTDKGNSLA